MPHYGREYTAPGEYRGGRSAQREHFAIKLLRGLFRSIFWVLKYTWVTLLWVIAFFIFTQNDLYAVLFLVVLGGLIILAALKSDTRLGQIAQHILPFRSEFLQWQKRKETERANSLLRRLRLAEDRDPTTYAARQTKYKNGVSTLVVSARLATLTDEARVREIVAANLAAVPAADFDLKKYGVGTYRIRFYASAKPDPLANLPALNDVPTAPNLETIPYGYEEEGNQGFFSLKDCSGVIVGGLPGGGKTAGLTALLAPTVHLDAAQFVVFDGKGGADWSWIKNRASIFNNNDEDLSTVADQLEHLVQMMRQRLEELPAVRGGSSIWNTGGPDRQYPQIIVIVDECQTYLDKSNFSRDDKEGLAYRQRIEAALANLVRKGRSVGFTTILATQKPTSDSIPTTIGANAAKNIGFRVKTDEAEKAIFGSAPAPTDPSATELPTVPGYVVMGAEDGSRTVARFSYIPEEVATAHADSFAHLVQEMA